MKEETREETRGRKPLPYKSFRKRYPKPLEEDIDKMVEEWKKEMGYA
ncbi:hypothetical protein NVP1036O_16 [Vibrio phage 1.036.O._10N.286.45.C3]|nr:hypothetical protein NVP1036O_16 [Vibrio phage 1.036.O._10N.286.45.C3]